MGIRAVYGDKTLPVITGILSSEDAKRRRRIVRRRLGLYRDDASLLMATELARIFPNRSQRGRLERFAFLSTAMSLFKRVVNEVAGPVYARPPTRRFNTPQAQAAFEAWAREARWNERMDLACRMTVATNDPGLLFRYSERVGAIIDVLTGDRYDVIPDPDAPARPLGIAYDKLVSIGGETETRHVVWDDEETFELAQNMTVVFGVPRSTRETGHPGVLPFVPIHMRERTDAYFDTSSGSDLEAGQGAISTTAAMAFRQLQLGGHSQYGVNGDPAGFPRGQTLDGENPVMAGEGNTLTVVSPPQPPDGHLRVIETIAMMVAANYGVSRDRMNAKGGEADMVALLERREEMIRIFADVERRAFQIAKVISQSHVDPDKRIPDDAEIVEIDFAEISHKVERIRLLDIWEREIKIGIRSAEDCVRADNPEILTDEQARAEIVRNLESRAWMVDMLKRLNLRDGGGVGEPGQTPETNGAMGPMVRDGDMSRDVAAEASHGAAVTK